jgi:hypothetical protein
MKFKTRLGMASAFLVSLGAIAWAAGNWSTLPIVGNPSFCGSTVSGAAPPLGGITGQGQATGGSICGQTIPAGPSLSDLELIPADTGIAGGASPQTVVIPSGLLGGLNLKINRLVGGDMWTNLWQRTTTPVSAATPTAALMTADRWWVQTATSSGTQVTVAKETGSTVTNQPDYLPQFGSYASIRIQRPSSQTGTAPVCFGQTLDRTAAAPLLNHNAVFSFYAQTGANWSPTAGNVTVSIAAFTAGDASGTQATIGYAGGNSSTAALSAAGQTGGITNYTPEVFTVGANTTGTVASGVATVPIPLSTVFGTQYTVVAYIPQTLTSAATQVTGVSVAICWTPTGTAGTNDWIEFDLLQLQAMPGSGVGNGTVNLPNGIITATGFERRAPVVEQLNQLYYSYVVNETAASNIRGMCAMSTSSIANCLINFPVPMRIVPAMKYTAGFAASATTASSSVAACTGVTTSATLSTNAATTSAVLVDCASSTGFGAAGTAGFLWDGSGSGVISASAEP